MTYVLTRSGFKVSLIDPKPEQICINDIAYSLSRQCRFNGHCKPFYSVAQHCMHVATLVPDKLSLPALLHDAHEAYIGDIVSPLRVLLPDLKPIIKRLDFAIEQKFNLTHGVFNSEKIVKADLLALSAERETLMPYDEPWQSLTNIPTIKLSRAPIKPKKAEKEFLDFFEAIL